jgi:hypothetical protein
VLRRVWLSQSTFEVVCPRVIDNLPVRKFISFELLRDTCLQATFQSISCEVVRPAKLLCAEQGLRFPRTQVGQILQISAIHADNFTKIGDGLPGPTAEGLNVDHSHRLKISEPLVPPNPNEFDNAMWMGPFCGWLGT